MCASKLIQKVSCLARVSKKITCDKAQEKKSNQKKKLPEAG